MTNSNQKRAIRARMAATGENYTTARRALQEERMSLNPPHGEGYWPAATGGAERDRLRDRGWALWDDPPAEPSQPEHHHHIASDGRTFGHRHQGGDRPHDHRPALPS